LGGDILECRKVADIFHRIGIAIGLHGRAERADDVGNVAPRLVGCERLDRAPGTDAPCVFNLGERIAFLKRWILSIKKMAGAKRTPVVCRRVKSPPLFIIVLVEIWI
jgi:hypothetical protein